MARVDAVRLVVIGTRAAWRASSRRDPRASAWSPRRRTTRTAVSWRPAARRRSTLRRPARRARWALCTSRPFTAVVALSAGGAAAAAAPGRSASGSGLVCVVASLTDPSTLVAWRSADVATGRRSGRRTSRRRRAVGATARRSPAPEPADPGRSAGARRHRRDRPAQDRPRRQTSSSLGLASPLASVCPASGVKLARRRCAGTPVDATAAPSSTSRPSRVTEATAPAWSSLRRVARSRSTRS